MTASHSTTASERRAFAARMRMLPETAAFVEAFCARHGIGRDDTLRLVLIVEELFTNTVAHGYRQECDAPIRIELTAEGGQATLFYEDAAPRHDPLSPRPGLEADLAAPIEARPIGRLGVHLVRQLAASARYAYADGCNRLWLTLPREAL